MEDLLKWGKFVFENYGTILNGIDLILAGFISIFTLIPGPEPERTLKKIVEFIEVLSIKKKKRNSDDV